ncbi:MAG: D-2-hydroxyacid dehydrogenase [Isosphaeraceae bacterium]
MKMVIHPAVEAERLDAIQLAAPGAEFVNSASEEEARAAIPGADALLGKITPGILERADRLRWVQAFTVSLEHYVFPALIEHACVLTNMRGLFSDVIADQVMGYVICFARNLHVYIRNQREHRYEPCGGESARVDNASGPGTVNAMDRATIFLPDASMGIFGFGEIGREVARRARAFGMTVRAVDCFPDRAGQGTEGVEVGGPDRLPDLLGCSDFVVIAAPHTPETERLFDRRLLSRMKPNSYLINIGRGAIVVLDDLVEALRNGSIAGAALDVYEQEPLPTDHPLWDLPNAILTPHTAGYSTAIAPRHLATLTANVGRFCRGEPLLNVVDKALWF